MSLRDELAMEPSAADVQQAYDEAGRYEFMGRRLEPWTIRRQSVAIALGCKIMSGMEGKTVESYLATGFYSEVFRDLIICLYLMHLNKRQVVELEELSKTDAMDRAYDWAEAIPLIYGTALFFEGAKVLAKILHAMQKCWFQAVTEAGENGEKKILTTGAIDRPGNSSSVSEQFGPPDTTPNM
jgi:hypothetical protein